MLHTLIGHIATWIIAVIAAGGYAGIAWSMLGKFDRAWFDRPIFGKRRYMSGGSTGKKFDSKRYIKQIKTQPD